jgi:hypothetical protein
MRHQPIGVVASLCSLALAALAAPLPAQPPGQVVQKLTPVVQLAVMGTTHIHFDFVGFCDVCDFDRARVVSRQISIFTNHTLHSADAFNELWQPGAFAQTVSGLGSPQAFAQLQGDIAAANLPAQAEDCSVPIVYHSTIFDGGQFEVSTALDHDYVLTWFGPGTAMRTLHLVHDRPACSVELRRVVLDILGLEQEVIGDTPRVDA